MPAPIPGQDDDFLATMLGDFLDESQGYLRQLNDNLLELDELARAAGDGAAASVEPEMLNEMFRAAHSLKGLSGMLRLGDINALTHKIENVFDAARQSTLPVTSEVVDLMFQAVDRLVAMIDQLNQPSPEEVDFQEVAEGIQRLLQEAGAERAMRSATDVEQAFACAAADAAESAPAGEATPCSSELVQPADEAARASGDEQDSGRPMDDDPFVDLTDESEVNTKYLAMFVDEIESSLDGVAELLLSDSAADSAEPLLVACHRIKGTAATIGLRRPARLAHAMEDLLQDLTERKERLSPRLVDALLACVDALRAYVDGLKRGQSSGDGFSAALGGLRTARKTGGSPRAPETTGPSAAPPREHDLAQVAALAPGGVSGWVGALAFDHGLPLAEVKAAMIHDRLSQLGEVFFCDPPANELEAAAGLSRLAFGLAAEAAEADVRARLAAEGVTCAVLAPLASFRRPPSPSASGSAPPAAACEDAKAKKVVALRDKPAPAEEAGGADEGGRGKGKPAETLRVDIERLDQLMNLAGQLVINKARFGQIGDKLKSLATLRNSAQSLSGVFASLDKLAAFAGDRGAAGDATLADAINGHVRQLRVDLEPVQRELGHLSVARGLVHDLTEAVHQLDRVTDGIQKSVMDTRMVPIGPLFGRFKRVIRDITRANGKDIRLVIRGEKTELDKRMIDELSDPLIHLVRNAADHGVEPPAAREAAGKPPQGVVTLDAFHRGNRIVIQVSDDGRGLDAERIRAKAVEKGLLSAADAERLTPHQAYQLIWEPGFSTAEKVTEVSGRGMGMDIVRSKIEELSGGVELDSEPGRGTVFTIKLPLTMAILPSLLTEISGDVFAIPVESIVEIVRFRENELTTIHGLTTATVRGRVVSIADLEALFQWRAAPAARRTAVIVSAEGRELGVLVDDLMGEQDIVIKSLAENYRNVPGMAGASILGDGRVSLILDVGAVLDMACRPAGRRESAAADKCPSG